MNRRIDIVIDLETLGQGNNAPILSIGAVAVTGAGTAAAAIASEFYSRVDLESAIARGAVPDSETIEWWWQQSPEARAEIDGSRDRDDIRAALVLFSNWLLQQSEPQPDQNGCLADVERRIWGNSPSFDCVILGNAYRIGGNLVPWHHREERDLRTLLDLYPAAKTRYFNGIRHHALHDARHEAHQLIQALSVHALRLECAKAEASRVASLGQPQTCRSR
ncbi:3'-5' exonuclease [Pseudomonas benzopyrenica]|uniref:3'-5' exonuclease n=1 Tax=Pseudomonas benzopyrenica TaxID=2993566 RepID=UPI0022829053|nr:3'-5' exonuclease [Pseudomonas benzopyrenica]MDC7831636.1 3'-5' exoribonuclease [Pseudomonas benzopyrenica]